MILCPSSIPAHDVAWAANKHRGARGRGEHEQRQQEAEREHERAVHLRAHGERHAARGAGALKYPRGALDACFTRSGGSFRRVFSRCGMCFHVPLHCLLRHQAVLCVMA